MLYLTGSSGQEIGDSCTGKFDQLLTTVTQTIVVAIEM